MIFAALPLGLIPVDELEDSDFRDVMHTLDYYRVLLMLEDFYDSAGMPRDDNDDVFHNILGVAHAIKNLD